jgi:uncharacterized protein DUF642
MRLSKTFIVAAALCLLPTLSFAQLVNSGFEPDGAVASYVRLLSGATDIPGWTVRYEGVEWWDPLANGNVVSPNGGYCVNVALIRGAISQTFATVPGQEYDINFWVGTMKANGRDGTCEVYVYTDVSISKTFAHSTTSATLDWVQKTYAFVATGTSATIWFCGFQFGNAHYTYIDGPSIVTPLPVEQTTWGSVKALYR